MEQTAANLKPAFGVCFTCLEKYIELGILRPLQLDLPACRSCQRRCRRIVDHNRLHRAEPVQFRYSNALWALDLTKSTCFTDGILPSQLIPFSGSNAKSFRDVPSQTDPCGKRLRFSVGNIDTKTGEDARNQRYLDSAQRHRVDKRPNAHRPSCRRAILLRENQLVVKIILQLVADLAQLDVVPGAMNRTTFRDQGFMDLRTIPLRRRGTRYSSDLANATPFLYIVVQFCDKFWSHSVQATV